MALPLFSRTASGRALKAVRVIILPGFTTRNLVDREVAVAGTGSFWLNSSNFTHAVISLLTLEDGSGAWR